MEHRAAAVGKRCAAQGSKSSVSWARSSLLTVDSKAKKCCGQSEVWANQLGGKGGFVSSCGREEVPCQSSDPNYLGGKEWHLKEGLQENKGCPGWWWVTWKIAPRQRVYDICQPNFIGDLGREKDFKRWL